MHSQVSALCSSPLTAVCTHEYAKQVCPLERVKRVLRCCYLAQAMIAEVAHLRIVPWDGYLKYYNLAEKVRALLRCHTCPGL
jgi:hypothetical protein